MKSKLIEVLIAIIGIVMVLWLLDDSSMLAPVTEKMAPAYQVTVVNVTPTTKRPNIKVTGTIKPRWKIDLIANVSGRVVKRYEDVLPGSFVKKDQVIAQIEDIDYTASLASAESRIAQAKLNLARFINEQTVAKRLENGDSTNDYRLHKPHVEAAKAELKAAQAGYQAALKRFNDTKIKAPFDAIVLDKYIVPAKQVNQGEHLYALASADAVDVEVNLSQSQWQQVVNISQVSAEITDVEGNQWQTYVRYLSPKLNRQTRQRELFLTIDNPYKSHLSLFPDLQVNVAFTSKEYHNAVVTPATVLTRDNKVWTIQNGELKLEKVQLLEESATEVMFTFSENAELTRQVVLYPLSTMIAGQPAQATPIVTQGAK